MPYEARWNTATPGCVLLLLDQSNSMSEAFGGDQTDAGETKAEALARVCNETILMLAEQCRDQLGYKPRVDISIIGYGLGIDGKAVKNILPSSDDFVSVAELVHNPLRTEERPVKHPITKNPIPGETEAYKIWVEANAQGWTPICKAIKTIDPMIEKWVMQHPESFPPIVVHITDGHSTDGDPRPSAYNLMRHATNDGGVLFFNCHLSTEQRGTEKYPVSKSTSVFPNDQLADVLFDMSSPLTNEMRTFAQAKNIKNPCPDGSRGFVFNGSIQDLGELISVGSSRAM